jgi:excisionase family DNA binding protein
MDGFMTIAECAERARVSTRTIRRALHVSIGPLRHFKIGTRVIIAEADFQKWLAAHVAMPAVTVAPSVLAQVSPVAREFLAGFCTPAAPGASKAANSQG